MSNRLLRPDTESYYHCIDRVVDRKRCLRDAERHHFRRWMRRLERFCGVQVVTYCLMENHFHLLVRVPCREKMLAAEPLTEARLRELLPLIYGGRELLGAVQELDRAAQQDSTGKWLAEILARYEARRFSLSIFLKELKQRYTRWHNRRHRRNGTLWEDRFRSVLVEGDERLRNPYAAIVVDPARHPHVDAAASQAFVGWLLSEEGQAAIGSLRAHGRRLFTPDARPRARQAPREP